MFIIVVVILLIFAVPCMSVIILYAIKLFCGYCKNMNVLLVLHLTSAINCCPIINHIYNCMWAMKDQESAQMGCTLEKFILK